MRRVARALVVIAISVPLVASMPGRAVACSCAVRSAQHVIEDADAIVAGHVTAQAEADPMHTMSTLVVDGVYAGRVGPTLTLSTEIGSGGASDCAVLYPVGSKVDPLVLFERPNGTYGVDACAMPVARQVAQLLGAAHPPSADGPPAVPLPVPTQAPPPAAAPSTGAHGVSWPAVLGGALLGAGLIAWAIRRTAREHVGGGPAESGADVSESDAGTTQPPAEPSG